jgi:hypothetical protein
MVSDRDIIECMRLGLLDFAWPAHDGMSLQLRKKLARSKRLCVNCRSCLFNDGQLLM